MVMRTGSPGLAFTVGLRKREPAAGSTRAKSKTDTTASVKGRIVFRAIVCFSSRRVREAKPGRGPSKTGSESSRCTADYRGQGRRPEGESGARGAAPPAAGPRDG